MFLFGRNGSGRTRLEEVCVTVEQESFGIMGSRMKKGRRKVSLRGQLGIVRARFLAAMLVTVMIFLYGVLYAVGIVRGMPAVFLPAREHLFKETYDACCASFGVVKILCGDFRGSGVVIAQDEDGVVIVSAKHLLMYDVRAEVRFAGTESGESVMGEVLGYSMSYDLAYLYVPGEVFGQESDIMVGVSNAAWAETGDADGKKAHVRTDDAYRELRAGDFIIQIGLSENASLEYYEGTAQAKEVFISAYNASMLLNECYAKAGMSGGGAFDENGRLVGIIIAGDDQGTVCMPMTTVLAEYRELVLY